MNKTKLKGYRTGAGLSQEKMASEIGMPLSTYIYKEGTKGEFNSSEIKKIIDVLNLHSLNVKFEDFF